MLVKIVSVPKDCRSLDNLTDIMLFSLPPNRSTKTHTTGLEFENLCCGQEIQIQNGTDEDIEVLRKEGVIVKRIE